MEGLYHYTTASGLLGIVTTSTLWASDHRFLNDAQEAVYARDLLVDAVRNMPNPVADPKHPAHHHGEVGVQTFADYQGFIVDELNSWEFGVYVACFCESGDLLSQWRGYGSDHGYAIEFSRDALERAVDNIPTYPPAKGLIQVRYGHAAADEVVQRTLDGVAQFNLNHPGVKAHYAAMQVNAMLAAVKHPGFKEEREWRLFAALEDFAPSSPATAKPPEAARFRATPMAIVPFLEIPIEPDALMSIRVGPGIHGALREASVRRLLKSVGSGATVVQSEIPLRG